MVASPMSDHHDRELRQLLCSYIGITVEGDSHLRASESVHSGSDLVSLGLKPGDDEDAWMPFGGQNGAERIATVTGA